MTGTSREHGVELLQHMIRIRRFEEKAAELYSQQKIRGFLHLYVGEEAIAVGAIPQFSADDNIVATYREHAHAIMRGVPPGEVMAEMYGKENGCARGHGGSMHMFSIPRRFYGGYAIVGGGMPIAIGLALADRLQHRNAMTACFFGDGATDEGEFHEALNIAALWKLPVLFLCENNLYAMGTEIHRHESDVDLTHKPAGYGIVAEAIDGMDVVSVERAVRYAADMVRETGVPRFLELRTYRYRAHSMYDPERYRTKEEIQHWKERDPIDLFTSRLRQAGHLDDGEIERIESEIASEIEEAIEFAEQGEWESADSLTDNVYAREVGR